MTEPRTREASGSGIVSFCSGKGGVGKSILAFNLAERLAALGVRVLLVDADSNFGNLHIMANVESRYGFREFVRGELSLNEAKISTPYGFDMLAAGGGEVAYTDSDITPVANALAVLRGESSRYDMILIDHSSGISKSAEVMAHASDTIVLVLVPELTSISDSYGLFKHLKQSDRELSCCLLVNRTESTEEADYISNKLQAVTERFVGCSPTYLGCLAEDSNVRKSVAGQTALSHLDPEAQVTQALTVLARRLMAIYGLSEKVGSVAKNDTKNEINKTTALADIRE